MAESHPPPYGTDQSPVYELQERPSLAARATGSNQTFDDATIESCAPKQRPRKLVLTRKTKFWITVALLALAGFLSAMIWLGVTTKRERNQAHPAVLSLATSTVDPWVPSTLVPADGTLLSPFNFSSSTPIFVPFDADSHTTSNYTILSSSSPPIHLNSTSSLAIKLFGNRSSQVTFVQGNNASSDTVVEVTALWTIPAGSNETLSSAWGLDQLSKMVGGGYGSGESIGTGVVLATHGDVSSVAYWESASNEYWNDILAFNLTVTIPPSSSIANLTVFAESSTSIHIGDLANIPIDAIDIRAPHGYVSSDSEAGITANSIDIFAGTVILGTWNTYKSLFFNCRGVIQPNLNFLPSPSTPSYNTPFSATLLAKNLPNLASSYIQANITSLPLNSNLTFLAVNLNSSASNGLEVQFPLDLFSGYWNISTNEGDARTSEENPNGSFDQWAAAGKLFYEGRTTPGGVAGEGAADAGNGSISLNAGKGDVQLVFGRKPSSDGVWL